VQTQIIQRTLGNIVVGGASQMAVDRAKNPLGVKTVVAAAALGVGLGAKAVQIFGYRGQRRPWLDLIGDTLASSGGTLGGEVLGYQVDGKLLAPPHQTTTTTTTTTTTATTPAASASTGANTSMVVDTYDADNDLENALDQD